MELAWELDEAGGGVWLLFSVELAFELELDSGSEVGFVGSELPSGVEDDSPGVVLPSPGSV